MHLYENDAGQLKWQQLDQGITQMIRAETLPCRFRLPLAKGLKAGHGSSAHERLVRQKLYGPCFYCVASPAPESSGGTWLTSTAAR